MEIKLFFFLKIEETEDVLALAEDIINCGYTGCINVDKKNEIIKCAFYVLLLFEKVGYF